MANMAKARFNFRYQPGYYTVQGAANLSDKALRAEYTRMRDVAEKRIHRLEKTFAESKAFSQHKEGFPKLSELDPRDLTKAFADLAKFVGAKTSTVSGQREAQRKTMETLNRAVGAGPDQAGVTKDNYWRVIKILEESRKRKILYGSDKVITLAEATMNFSNAQFNDVLDNLEKSLINADKLSDIPELNGYNFNEVISKLSGV